jgi:hypothetical protein
MVPQAKLLMDYCRSTKAHLSSPTIKGDFLLQYAKAREVKRKEGERIRRREEHIREKLLLVSNVTT